MKITAAVAREAHKPFCVEEVELSEPRDNEILVKITAVGLCHTDLVVVDRVLPIPLPAVLGHEGSGIVAAVGKDVTKVKPGDRVVLTFNSCGKCSTCAAGEPAYCQNFMGLNYAGVRPDGSATICSCGQPFSASFFGQSSFASYALGNEQNVVKVADDVDLTLLGPLGCGFQTGAGAVMRSLKAKPGSTIVIFGGGPVGLSAVMGAKVQGCANIILVEPVAVRRELGLELGATVVIDPVNEDVAGRVRAIVPAGANYALDTSGALPAIHTAVNCLTVRGELGLVGVPSKPEAEIKLNLIQALSLGITVRGIIEGDSVPDEFIPELAALYRDGKFPLDRLVKTYPFAAINEAVEDQTKGRCVKAILVF
jgi:aryl-alcohol dehydrogenase